MRRSITVDRRVSAATLWTTCAIALAILPRAMFPWAWIAAFVVPSVLLHVLIEHRERPLTHAVPIAGAVHVGTVFAALAIAGPIASETALGCSLLPPLAFLAARRRGEDVVWGLFLALCAVLIATILGSPPAWLLWSFLASGFVTLQVETMARAASRRRAWRGAFGPRRLAIGGLFSCLVATLAVAFSALQLLANLPKPGDPTNRAQRAADAGSGRSSVGLSDRFEFGASSDGFLDLRNDELLRVRAIDELLEDDLYLRTAHFELPGLARWSKARPNDRSIVAADAVRHRGDEVRGWPKFELELNVHEAAEQFLFLPPGTLGISGIEQVIGNPRQETFARLQGGAVDYRVAFQDRRALAPGCSSDRSFENLARLPREFDPHLDHFADLIREAGGARAVTPSELVDRLTRVLHRDFRYELREPRGPYGDQSILNFVAGEHAGFCMHFASTLAICLRLAGVPCRVAVGLYAGPSELANNEQDVVLGSQHAHAWVEIPLEGLGWVVFDPTPPAHVSAGSEPDTSIDPGVIGTAAIVRWLDSRAAWVLISVCALGLWIATGRQSRAAASGTRRAEPVDPDLAARFRALIKALERLVPRARGDTLQQYAAVLAQDERIPIDLVEGAFIAYEEVRYGRRPLDDERSARIRDAVRATKRVERPRR